MHPNSLVAVAVGLAKVFGLALVFSAAIRTGTRFVVASAAFASIVILESLAVWRRAGGFNEEPSWLTYGGTLVLVVVVGSVVGMAARRGKPLRFQMVLGTVVGFVALFAIGILGLGIDLLLSGA